jgi:riboflavin synthase
VFTGIVEEMGTIRRIQPMQTACRLHIGAKVVLEGTSIGDSIAVCGVCLTVTGLHSDGFEADVMPETLRRSNLGQLTVGARVHLERAVAVGGRLGGHIVTGHIDGTGKLLRRRPEGNAEVLTFGASAEILRHIVEKGSIAIDGISLTVMAVDATTFSVGIIPHTAKETTLLTRKVGDSVNLECDIVGKYVEKLLGNSAKTQGLSQQFLFENGF